MEWHLSYLLTTYNFKNLSNFEFIQHFRTPANNQRLHTMIELRSNDSASASGESLLTARLNEFEHILSSSLSYKPAPACMARKGI